MNVLVDCFKINHYDDQLSLMYVHKKVARDIFENHTLYF